ncbi:MAG TPA: ABC transporter ATP-binding protein [Devosia sp.]|nr:ABC transporter ATP-binding protein [Devosia sp.]
MSETILSVEHLTVVFHTYAGVVEAVRDVSFTLGKGEVLAIVGESGSGKSVTAQAVMGLTPIPPGEIRGGSVTYRGTDMVRADIAALARIRGEGISMIFQDPMTSLNPSMQIGKQIREVLHQHKAMSAAESTARAIELLRLVGIPEPESRLVQYPHQFSGGMRQRIMIAIAIANNPDILLADEPTTALDVTIQSQIFRLIRDIQKQFGTAMILITHDLGLVAGAADRIAVMYGGRIVEEGLTEQIYYNPQHPYTLGLLNAVPKLTDKGDAPLRTIEGLPPLLIDPPDACAFADRCPFVMKICRRKDPDYFAPVADNRVACWLHHETAAAQRAVFDAARPAQ